MVQGWLLPLLGMRRLHTPISTRSAFTWYSPSHLSSTIFYLLTIWTCICILIYHRLASFLTILYQQYFLRMKIVSATASWILLLLAMSIGFSYLQDDDFLFCLHSGRKIKTLLIKPNDFFFLVLTIWANANYHKYSSPIEKAALSTTDSFILGSWVWSKIRTLISMTSFVNYSSFLSYWKRKGPCVVWLNQNRLSSHTKWKDKILSKNVKIFVTNFLIRNWYIIFIWIFFT